MSARLTANEQNNLYCQQDQGILTTYSCKQYKCTVVNLLSKHFEIYRLLLLASHPGFFACFYNVYYKNRPKSPKGRGCPREIIFPDLRSCKTGNNRTCTYTYHVVEASKN